MGDVFQNFSTLAMEIELTPTASNVLFGYWSHDVGGFHNGTDDPGDNDPKSSGAAELLLRWVQFGAFSPIFRTHGEPAADRYLWDFSTFPVMKELLLLRNALVPHIYTMAWQAHHTAVSILRPMYYAFPETEAAYGFKGQYMFGADVLVAPIASGLDAPGGSVKKPVWLPPVSSAWVTWDGLWSSEGGRVVNGSYALEDMPVFVRAGALLPTRTLASSRSVTADPLVWVVWIGSVASMEGAGLLYEDAGDGFSYQDSPSPSEEPTGWATTAASLSMADSKIDVRLFGTRGSYAGQPFDREVVLQLRGIPAGGRSSVVVNGLPAEAGGTQGSWVDPVGAVTVRLGRRGIRENEP